LDQKELGECAHQFINETEFEPEKVEEKEEVVVVK